MSRVVEKLQIKCDGVIHCVPVKLVASRHEKPFIIDYMARNGERIQLEGNSIPELREEVRKRLAGTSSVKWERQIMLRLVRAADEASCDMTREYSVVLKLTPFWIGTREDGVQVFTDANWDNDEHDQAVSKVEGSWLFNEEDEYDHVFLLPDTKEVRARLKILASRLEGLSKALAKALKGAKDEKGLKVALDLFKRPTSQR